MGSRIPSHQLSNGLYVSGRPELLKDPHPTLTSRAVPYTGGDVKNSGELGKMFDIPVVDHPPPTHKPSRHSSSSQHNSGSVRSGPNSGPVGTTIQAKSNDRSSSGPIPKKTSGPMVQLQPTGLITSGPLIGSGVGRRSGQLEPSASTVMGLLIGGFLTVAVKKVVILAAALAILVPVIVMFMWNCSWKKRGLLGFLRRYPDAELRGAIDGQFVKVTGIVTCGIIPLESSFQRVPRCVYVSTELSEYRGWGGKSANPKHCFFSWARRHSEKYVADFYISDFQTGLRALVKAGYGANVSPFVQPTTVVDIRKGNHDLSPNFLGWLSDRSLSSDDRVMRLKEGYIKEGSTVSVMGVVRRHDNVMMIIPPPDPISTGCQWSRCLLPTYVEGLVLTCDNTQNDDVIPV